MKLGLTDFVLKFIPFILASETDLRCSDELLTIESPSPVFIDTPTSEAECSSSCSSIVKVCTPRSAKDPPKLLRKVWDNLRLSFERLLRRIAGADAS